MQEFALACWQPPMTTPLRCAKSWQLLHVGEVGGLLELCHECLVCCRPLLGGLAQSPGELAGGGQLWRSRRRSHGRVLAMRMDPRGDTSERGPVKPWCCISRHKRD